MQVFRKVEAGAQVASGRISATEINTDGDLALVIPNVTFTPKKIFIIANDAGSKYYSDYYQPCRACFIDIENNECIWWTNYNITANNGITLITEMPTISYSGDSITIQGTSSYQDFTLGEDITSEYNYIILG